MTLAFLTPAAANLAAAVVRQDSVLGLLPEGVHPADSIVVRRFTPAPVVQWIFQQPPWLMWGGVVLAGVVALGLLWWLWPRLPGLWAGFKAWPTATKAWLFSALGLLLVVAAGLGFSGYDYMMNDSRFCTGCHIFVPPGQVSQIPADSGDYTLITQLRGKHDSINCHTCHTFKPFGEAVKMVFWMSGRRFEHSGLEEGAPTHGAVPRTICEDCHKQGDARETWQAVANTAGHKLHLESDSASGKLLSGSECLTCHAQTAHVFQPVDSTCSQQGCHLTEDVEIRLGRMTEAVGAHCVVCHEFNTEVPFYVSTDSARGGLRPTRNQCFSCHEMRSALATFDLAKDPHNGTCGMCHNPHTQAAPDEALKTCTDAGCHADWRGVPFHVGAAHRRVQQQCETCHDPHASRVDASDCTGCHESVRSDGRFRAPIPFDTTTALDAASVGPPSRARPAHPAVPTVLPGPAEPPARGKGDSPPREEQSWHPADGPPTGRAVSLSAARAPADTFEHKRHESLDCLTCHTTTSTTGTLVFEAPRGCQICHHQAPARSQCATCHAADEIPRSHEVQAVVEVSGEAPRPRAVAFTHEQHGSVACAECHTEPVSLAATRAVATCAACHDEHHADGSSACADCHRSEATWAAHEAARLPGAPPAAHRDCASCHREATVARLTPTRGFCLVCHEPEVDHYPQRECSTCHFLAEPAALRPSLLGRQAR